MVRFQKKGLCEEAMTAPQHTTEIYALADLSQHSPYFKILRLINEGWTILDIGCGNGILGKYLKKKQHKCNIIGIDISRDAAKIAKKYYDEVIISDIENMLVLNYNIKFDAIILADVLEHLRRPDIVLKDLKGYVKQGGYIIASIPNIGRFEIRIKLLFGKFDYQDIGILDKTHLRFFTQKTIYTLFNKEGYNVIKKEYTGLASKHYIFSLFPNLFTYQFIIIAQVGREYL